MTYNYPLFPQFYPRPYYGYTQKSNCNVNNNHINHIKSSNIEHEKNNSRSKNINIEDDVVFEIFGIKLHQDDILLICLIFFLYNEGVKDEFLFIVLVLLLLS